MLSKFALANALQCRNVFGVSAGWGPALVARSGLRNVGPIMVPWRRSGDYVPPTQYDAPPGTVMGKLKLSRVLRDNYEIYPLLACTGFALMLVFSSIIWACKTKVDLVFSTHSRNNISRTMNLRHPYSVKLITINQRYEPWPQMQDVLDKMKVAERRAMLKATVCSYESREGHPPEGAISD